MFKKPVLEGCRDDQRYRLENWSRIESDKKIHPRAMKNMGLFKQKEKDDNILWIFLHIPKTGGTTFRHHIEKNFKKDEIVRFYHDTPCIKPHIKQLNRDSIVHIKTEVENYISSLTEKEKNKIKVIYGHFVPYGIHKYFNKTTRYITFVRNPVDRTISVYNYLMTGYLDKDTPHEIYALISKVLLNDESEILPFDVWLTTKYCNTPENPMPRLMFSFLERLGYVKENQGWSTNTFFNDIMQKFYFIGIVKNFKEDAAFLYYKMGIKKFYPNQNISKKYFIPTNKIEEMILSKMTSDQNLYNCALEVNKTFKENNENFYTIVRFTKIKRGLILPLTEIPQLLYRVSAKARQHSLLYSNCVDFIKK